MPSLDAILTAYRSDATHQEALLAAATRYARRVAASLGAKDPDDIAQLVAVEVWKHSARITGSVTAWLRTVTKRLVYREHGREIRRFPAVAMPETEDEVASIQDHARTCRNPLRIADPQLRVAAGLLIHGFQIGEACDFAGLSRGQLQRRVTKLQAVANHS